MYKRQAQYRCPIGRAKLQPCDALRIDALQMPVQAHTVDVACHCQCLRYLLPAPVGDHLHLRRDGLLDLRKPPRDQRPEWQRRTRAHARPE